jgi:murein DD-endopeptidase MepM/ murein hydrolase activator NlpD
VRQAPFCLVGSAGIDNGSMPSLPADVLTSPLRRQLGRAALGVAALVLAGPATAQAPAGPRLPQPRLVPGGIAVVPLGAATQRPRASLEDKPVLVMGTPASWTAVAGIALATRPGPLELLVQRQGQAPQKQRFTVAAATYAVQRLTVPQRQVELSKEDLARHERERAHLGQVMATRSERVPAGLQMLAPVPGPRSSSFGLRRIFNGQSRSPHNGMDIAAPTGTPIVAPLPGVVIDTGDYFFAGRCVWLDHGSGVLTLYAHLDRIDVDPGRELDAGQALGTVGATGRVTGPHLHWSVMLNRAYVDPALLLVA